MTEHKRQPMDCPDHDTPRRPGGQYRQRTTSPNRGGLMSANPVVLSKDGDATSGNGHGRDRNGSRKEQG